MTEAHAAPPPSPPDDDEPAADLGELDETSRVLEAAEAIRRAEQLMADDLGAARTHAAKAIALDPTNAEYLGLHGYLVGIGGSSGDALRAGIADLDKALAMEAGQARAHYYRGALYRRLGEEPKALADFNKAAALDPADIDVQRELRAKVKAPEPAALQKVATPAKTDAPRTIPRAVVMLVALVLLTALGFGGLFVIRLFKRPPAAERQLRAHLLQNEVDHAFGPAHQGSYEHEDALDAMGPNGASQIVALLGDASRAEMDDIRSSKTVQQLANEYLIHYAATVAKKPAPQQAIAENPDWNAIKAAWADWLKS